MKVFALCVIGMLWIGCAPASGTTCPAATPTSPKEVGGAIEDDTMVIPDKRTRCIKWLPAEGDGRTIHSITRDGEVVRSVDLRISPEKQEELSQRRNEWIRMNPAFANTRTWVFCGRDGEGI